MNEKLKSIVGNKKIMIPATFVLSIALVAAVAVYFATVNVSMHVGEPFSTLTTLIGLNAYPGETSVQSFDITNDANVPLNVKLSWTEKANSYSLDNAGGVCPGDTCEKRITIQAEDVGIVSLLELNNMSWAANVLDGYLPHVDVILDNGEALVFEYAKVQPVCDNAPYPIGELNTFGNKGIVDGNAKAWLSSGVAGPCGNLTFEANYKTLDEWKAFYPDANILRFELEVDNWISESSSDIKNIKINGGVTPLTGVSYTTDMPKTLTLSPGNNTIDTNFMFASDTLVGNVDGKVILERTA